MSGIAKIDAWIDCGYLETSVEIPPKGHVLREPDLTLEGPFNPSKNREFSEVRVELPFVEAVNISYLRLHYDFNNGDDQVFYAWVDDVRLISDSADAPMVNILFHIDPWRTWSDKLTYGSGFVQRRPSTASDYWQNYPFRFKKESGSIPLIVKDHDITHWVLVASQHSEDGKTTVRWSTFPVSFGHLFYFKSSFEPVFDSSPCPNLEEVVNCVFDEWLGIDPKTITGAWMVPFQTFEGTLNGSGTREDPFTINSWNWKLEQKMDRSYLVSNPSNISDQHYLFKQQNLDGVPRVSSEQNQFVITSPFNEIIGTIPFNIPFIPSKMVLNATSTIAVIRLIFGKADEGLVFDFILPNLDINDNAWSSYVYSGQRDYENNMRNLQTISSTIEGAASGGGMGALIGGTNNIGTAGGNASRSAMGLEKILGGVGAGALMGGPAGAIAGFAIGAGASVIGGAVEGVFTNPLMQAEEDKLHANQSSTILIAGDFLFDYTFGDGQLKLTELVFDDESNAAIEANKVVQGVKFGQNMEDCNALIDGGGPMQISNLIIHGNAPVLAKKAIQAKFAKGVRIIAR